MLRFAKFSLEGASLKALAAGGASLAGVLAGGGLWYRQELLRHHPISAFAAAQLCASKDVQQLFESETVSTDGFIGGYVDMNSRTAVLTLPVQSANAKGVARVEAEATVVPANETRTSLDFSFGPDPLRWTLRHLEVVKDSPVATPARVLYSLPAHHPLPAWAPAREPSALRSLVSREAQALLPADNSLVGFVSFHVLGLALIVGWLRLRVRTERAHKALEAHADRAAEDHVHQRRLLWRPLGRWQLRQRGGGIHPREQPHGRGRPAHARKTTRPRQHGVGACQRMHRRPERYRGRACRCEPRPRGRPKRHLSDGDGRTCLGSRSHASTRTSRPKATVGGVFLLRLYSFF
jgi:hypothetical protein